ncbi:MAG: glycosyltransferase [Oligoflexia bacterium]|nr:glycosyltransferase [Oligoflexia bacterium]
MKIAIIIPAYNEEATISHTVRDMYSARSDAEIFVVNNNSTDLTAKRALETFRELGCKGSVLHEEMKGKANAIRTAFRKIDADIYVMIDADTTYSGKDLEKLIEPILQEKADIVVGDRFFAGEYRKQNSRAFHEFGNVLVNKFINFLFKTNLSDVMSGYRVFNKRFVLFYPIMCSGFELETEMTLHALDNKFKIKEIPVSYKERPSGSVSKLNTFRDGVRVIKTVINIFRDYRPFIFYGIISIVLLFFSIIFMYVVVSEYIAYRYITQVPLAVVSLAIIILSGISMTAGTILDTLVRYQKSNFQLGLNSFTHESDRLEMGHE